MSTTELMHTEALKEGMEENSGITFVDVRWNNEGALDHYHAPQNIQVVDRNQLC